MSEQGKRSGRGPGQGPGAPHAKPQSFRRTLMRVFGYLRGSLGLVLLILLALVVNSGASIAGSYFLRPLINLYILPGDLAGLAGGILILALVYVAGALASYVQMRTTIRLAQRTVYRIRRELFGKMQELPLRYYDTHTHGELMSRFSNDAENVLTMLEQSLVQLLSSAIMLVGVVCFMLILSPTLFVITALVVFCMFLVVKVMGGRSRVYFKSQQEILGRLNGCIEENIGGLKEIKAFNHEEAAEREFARLNDEFRETARKANFFAGAMMPIMVNLNNVSYALVAVVGGLLTAFGRFDVGSLAAYLQFSRHLGQPVNQISNQMNSLYSAVAGAERIFAMMDEQPEADEGTVTLEQVDGNADAPAWDWVKADGTRVPLRGDVRFHDVSFSYDPEKAVLHNVSLYAKPGQMIAFVGSTGAGKTTITNLINRFYDVQQGGITYDGIDVRDIRKSSLRRSLGMVLQDTHLFTDTVLGNLRYGRPDATDDECIEAAKRVGAHSFIKRLPRGYQTVLQGDGGNLSQGQRQLIAIARCYISRPPVMILDEATSSIDTRTERQLQRGMTELMKDRTVFVIAHRLSTVREAKAIIVLEDGGIIERGNHDELLEQRGRYYQLHNGLMELA